MEKELMINVKALQDWMNVARLSDLQFCKKIDFDQSNFSKMIEREIPTSKTLINKVLNATGLPKDLILDFDFRIHTSNR